MRNCNCNCNCKNAFVLKATSYTYTAGTSLVINTNSTLSTLYNGAGYLLTTCPALPAMATVVPVFVRIKGTNIPLQDAIGNTLFSDQIHQGRRYELVYGTTPSHFKLKHCSCLSSATPCTTTITTVAQSEPATEEVKD